MPLVAIATPATYVKEPLCVFELDFEANVPLVRACVKYQKRILDGGTHKRAFTHVSDGVDALIKFMDIQNGIANGKI